MAKWTDDLGFSMVEMMVTMAISVALMSTATFNFKELSQPALDGANSVVSFTKRARAKALATTYAYTIQPASPTALSATYGTTCSATQTTDDRLALVLPGGASFGSMSWKICFSARGISDNSVSFTISDDTEVKTLELAAGGGARFY